MADTVEIIDMQEDWVVTIFRYVAFFDIMGFKDMVARSKHEKVYEMMVNIDSIIKSTQEDIKQVRPSSFTETYSIKSTFFSDSIILYSKDDSYFSLMDTLVTVSTLTNNLLENSIPHKCAIAFGEMSVDFNKSIIFGQPLIDAYLLQEEIVLYIAVLHASAELEIEKKEFDVSNLLHEYACQFKSGLSRHKTVAPITLTANPSNEKQIESLDLLLEGVNKLRLNTSGHLRKYIDYTNTYIKDFRGKFLERRLNNG